MKSHLAGLALMLSAAPALAEGWSTTSEAIEVPAAGINLPKSAGIVSLTRTGESGSQGQGIDNVAQFASPDGTVEATAYIYRPAYPDSALTAMATARAIKYRWPGMALTSSDVVRAAGINNGAIRRIYEDGGEGRTTAAAFIKAGSWIVKLRVSGPRSQGQQVTDALDALIAGVSLSGDVKAAEAGELQLSECPAVVKKKAKKQSLAESLGLESNPMMEAILQGGLAAASEKKGTAAAGPTTLARDGFQPLCVRERLMIGPMEIPILQAVGDTKSPDSIILALSDAGDIIEMRREDSGEGYALLRHGIGETISFGNFDGPLSAKQLEAIISGEDRKIKMVSKTSYQADGKAESAIFVP